LINSKLRPYVQDVIKLDETFNLTHLHERTVQNMGFFALALAGEIGELCNIVKKIWRDGESEELWQQFDEEAVDVMIYFIELLNCAKCRFDEAWKKKHKVLYKRMKDKIKYRLDNVPLYREGAD